MGDASLGRAIPQLKRIQVRLIVVGGSLLVLTPLIVGVTVAAGAEWMRWFWAVSGTMLAAGLALFVWTAAVERRRWRRGVYEMARLDLEASAANVVEGEQQP